MEQERLSYLLRQYKAGLMTEKETDELREFCGPRQEEELIEWIRQNMESEELPQDNVVLEDLQELTAKILSVDKSRIRNEPVEYKSVGKIYRSRFLPWAAAAIILILLGTGTYFFLIKRQTEGVSTTTPGLATMGNDVAPGGNKAVLTLANGAKVVLDSAHNGLLVKQGNTHVTKVYNGLLTYNSASTPYHQSAIAVQYNTLTTPRGGEYQLKLPDGTMVWLNAASSITFPTVFTGKEREVTVTGESYFEVAENASMPFVVKNGKSNIQVLGTHFNINAYLDEPATKITLLEGSVKIQPIMNNVQHEKGHDQALVILPGEQVQINREGGMILNKEVDTSDVVAWKNGMFKFDNTSLTELMRQIARWYNVKVSYSGNLEENEGKYAFMGQIERNSDLSLVLKLLELGGIHFKIQNRNLIVTP